jgi:transposase
MAGKLRPMSQIKQLIRLHLEGHSIKSIARCLGISKNTVKSYLGKLNSESHSPEVLLQLEDPHLETMFTGGNPAYKEPRYIHLKGKLDYFTAELRKVGVTRKLLWEEYIAAFPEGYGHSQFCYHLGQQLVARKSTSVLLHLAADKLFIDFSGKKMHYINQETGEIIHCQIFVACLPFSDYAYAQAVPSQKMGDFLYALGCCLSDLGGVPKALVPDNLKSAVIKADRYEPDINRSLEDFANHYQTTIVPARPAKPGDKSMVENQVRMLYTRVYAKLRNHQFFDLVSLNEAIRIKIREHNQTRMQLKPYCREERFLAAEKPYLGPLPSEPFSLKYYKEPKVAHNGHLCLERHYYSVPFRFTGSRVKVIYTRTMVYVYAEGKSIAIHPRSYLPGGYSSTREHLSSQNQFYLERSPDYYLTRAQGTSLILHELITHLFEQNRYPEQMYRTCDGLFRLHRNTTPELFDRACRMAIDHRIYSYRFMQKILENKMTEVPQECPQERPLPVHENIRGKEYYIQTTLNL